MNNYSVVSFIHDLNIIFVTKESARERKRERERERESKGNPIHKVLSLSQQMQKNYAKKNSKLIKGELALY